MSKELFTPKEKRGLDAFKERVLKEFGDRVKLLKVFGSKVREESWEESDTDLLVLLRDLDWKEKTRLIDISTDVNLEYDLMLSPLVMSPEEFDRLLKRERRLALDIEKEGIPL